MPRTAPSRTAATVAPPANSIDYDGDTGDDTDMGPGREFPGTPRWVKLFGVIVIVLVLLVIIILFIGGHTSPVQHGP